MPPAFCMLRVLLRSAVLGFWRKAMSIEKCWAIAGLLVPLTAGCLQVQAHTTYDVKQSAAKVNVRLEHVITVDPNRMPEIITPVPTSVSSVLPQSTPIPTNGSAPAVSYCKPYIAGSVSWNRNGILALGITAGQGKSGCPTSGAIQIFSVSFVTEPRLRRTLHTANNPVKSIDFSHSGQLAAVEGDQEVRIYDDQSFAHLETLSNSTKPIQTLVYSHDGTLLAFGGGVIQGSTVKGEVMVYRVKDPITHLYTLDDKSNGASVLAFNKDSTQLAIAGITTRASVYNTTSSDLLQSVFFPAEIRGIDYSDDDDQLVIVGANEFVRVFSMKAGSGSRYTLDYLLPVGDGVTRVAYNRGGTEFAVGVFDGTVRIFDTNDLSASPQILPYVSRAKVLDLAFSPDGTKLAVSWNDGKVSIYRVSKKATVENDANYLTPASLPLAMLFAAFLGGVLLPR